MPDPPVNAGKSRSFPDTTGIATWLDGREPSYKGELTRKAAPPDCEQQRRGPTLDLRVPSRTDILAQTEEPDGFEHG